MGFDLEARTNGVPLTDEDLEDIRRMYPDQPTKEIANWIGCTTRTVLYNARKLGLPRKRAA
jgi:hypothetical protein